MLYDTIQKISQGALYSENALNKALAYKVLNNVEKQSIVDKIKGINSPDINMRLQDIAIKVKLHNKSGSLTSYGFLCGYQEIKVSLKSEDYITLSKDCLYHVKGHIGLTRIWESFDSLTSARKFYRSIRIK